MDGRMDGWFDARTAAMDGLTHGWMEGWTDGWMDGWTDAWMDGQRDELNLQTSVSNLM